MPSSPFQSIPPQSCILPYHNILPLYNLSNGNIKSQFLPQTTFPFSSLNFLKYLGSIYRLYCGCGCDKMSIYKKKAPQIVLWSAFKDGGYLLSHLRSTIGVNGLNFSVRNGKRWNPAAIATWMSVQGLYNGQTRLDIIGPQPDITTLVIRLTNSTKRIALFLPLDSFLTQSVFRKSTDLRKNSGN